MSKIVDPLCGRVKSNTLSTFRQAYRGLKRSECLRTRGTLGVRRHWVGRLAEPKGSLGKRADTPLCTAPLLPRGSCSRVASTLRGERYLVVPLETTRRSPRWRSGVSGGVSGGVSDRPLWVDRRANGGGWSQSYRWPGITLGDAVGRWPGYRGDGGGGSGSGTPV